MSFRIAESKGGPGLLEEAPRALGIGNRLGAQQLDRYRSAEPRVAGAVQHAHAAFAQLVRDFETAEHLASHVAAFKKG